MNLPINTNAGEQTMSSLEIADLCEKGHRNVLADIRKVLAELNLPTANFSAVYEAGNGQKYECFNLPRRECDILIAGYSIKYRAAIVDRWHELESQTIKPGDPQLPNFSDPAAAARAWADEVEAKQQAVALIEKQKPAVEFVGNYVAATTGSKGFRQVAKLIKANERELRSYLSDNKIMYKLGGEWMPYQNHIDAGRFEVKAGVSGDHAFNQAKFTAKGINWLAELWAQNKIEVTA